MEDGGGDEDGRGRGRGQADAETERDEKSGKSFAAQWAWELLHVQRSHNRKRGKMRPQCLL